MAMIRWLATTCALLAMLTTTYAQPCIECQDCRGSSNCLSRCQRTCSKQDTVDLGKCRRAGQEAGKRVAQGACDLAQLLCKGGRRATAAAKASRQVTLKQCGNAAFGECQRLAKDSNQSPCGRSFNGVDLCTAESFRSFYDGEVDERCNREADVIERNGP